MCDKAKQRGYGVLKKNAILSETIKRSPPVATFSGCYWIRKTYVWWVHFLIGCKNYFITTRTFNIYLSIAAVCVQNGELTSGSKEIRTVPYIKYWIVFSFSYNTDNHQWPEKRSHSSSIGASTTNAANYYRDSFWWIQFGNFLHTHSVIFCFFQPSSAWHCLNSCLECQSGFLKSTLNAIHRDVQPTEISVPHGLNLSKFVQELISVFRVHVWQLNLYLSIWIWSFFLQFASTAPGRATWMSLLFRQPKVHRGCSFLTSFL